jgi:putative membrane protein
VKKFLQSWLINTLAVLVAVYVVPGIRFENHDLWTPFVTSLVLGILNTFIRPLLTLVTIWLVVLTLGLFRLVINAALLYFVSFLLTPYFHVASFGAAFLGALVISVVSFLLHLLTGGSKTRIQFTHRRRPPDSGPGGGGPIIDI